MQPDKIIPMHHTSKHILIELLYSCLIGILVFFVVYHVSAYFVNRLIYHEVVRFTLYEGFAGICFLVFSMLVCFLYFRIPRLRIIPVTVIAFIGAFLMACADYYVDFYINADNGTYTWNIFASHLQDIVENSFNLQAIYTAELWWFIDLLLIGIITKKCIQIKKTKSTVGSEK